MSNPGEISTVSFAMISKDILANDTVNISTHIMTKRGDFNHGRRCRTKARRP